MVINEVGGLKGQADRAVCGVRNAKKSSSCFILFIV